MNEIDERMMADEQLREQQFWATRAQQLKDSGQINTCDFTGNTPLMRVPASYEAAKHLIKAGADIYMRNIRGNSALYFIGTSTSVSKETVRLYISKVEKDCRYNKEKIAKIFVEEYWSLHKVVLAKEVGVTRAVLDRSTWHKRYIDDKDSMGRTALHVAVENDDIDNIKLLLEYNANVNATGERRPTSLSYVFNDKNNKSKYAKRKLDILKLLLDKKAESTNKSIDNAKDIENFLMQANTEAIEMLIKYGIDVSIINTEKNSAMHVLAKNQNPDVIEMLYDRSFNIDARDICNHTPLMVAAQFGNARALEFLLNHDADIEAKDKTQRTPLFLVVQWNRGEQERRRECLQILLERGANAQVAGHTRHYGYRTVFEAIAGGKNGWAAPIVLAHLALQQLNGTPIIELIRSKIHSQDQYKDFFESSKQQLTVKIYNSLTLFDLLMATSGKLERYVRNEEMVSKLRDFIGETSDYCYFRVVLQKRLSKVLPIVKLRQEAGQTICRIMKMNYERFPLIADNIVSYLDEKNMKNFICALI